MTKNFIFLKFTKSLCAVFLAFCMIFCFFPEMLMASETLPEEETTPFAPSAVEIANGETLSSESEEEIMTLEKTLETTEMIQTSEMETLFAEETVTSGPENTVDPNTGTTYRYNLDIQFGSLGFYYDWGTWDTETLSYKANESSANPAAGTKLGDPGWYGFDGITNKISFINTSSGGEGNNSLYVRLEYHTTPFGDAEAFPSLSSDVKMNFYLGDATNQFQTLLSSDPQAGAVIAKIPRSEATGEKDAEGNTIYQPTDIYISMSGTPYTVTKDGGVETITGRFHSTASVSIGFLKITVGVKPENLIPQAQGAIVNGGNTEFFVDQPFYEETLFEDSEETLFEETTTEESETQETEETEEPIYTMSRDFY